MCSGKELCLLGAQQGLYAANARRAMTRFKCATDVIERVKGRREKGRAHIHTRIPSYRVQSQNIWVWAGENEAEVGEAGDKHVLDRIGLCLCV